MKPYFIPTAPGHERKHKHRHHFTFAMFGTAMDGRRICVYECKACGRLLGVARHREVQP